MTGIQTALARRAADLSRGLDSSLALLSLIAFTAQVGVAVMLPLLPLYAVALGADPFVLGLMTSSFAVTNAVGQMLAGFLAERLGSRRLVPAGMGLYAGANALIATATAALPLIVWRSLAGLGGGLGLISERLYLVEVIDRARLAFANGLLSAAGSAGTVAGPAVGGLIAAASDLRGPFLLVAVTSALAAGAALFLPRPRVALAAADGTVSEPVAMPTQAPTDWRTLSILLVANIGMQAGFGSFITTYGPYATGELGWSTVEVGLLFSLFGLGSILVGPWLGHLADQRGRRRIAVLSTLPVIAFVIALVAGAPVWIIIVATVAAGGGIAGFGAAWYALLSDATGGAKRGGAFGTISALSNLGIVAGAMGSAALWAAIDLRAGMATVGLALAVAGVAMLALPDDRPGRPGR